MSMAERAAASSARSESGSSGYSRGQKNTASIPYRRASDGYDSAAWKTLPIRVGMTSERSRGKRWCRSRYARMARSRSRRSWMI